MPYTSDLERFESTPRVDRRWALALAALLPVAFGLGVAAGFTAWIVTR